MKGEFIQLIKGSTVAPIGISPATGGKYGIGIDPEQDVVQESVYKAVPRARFLVNCRYLQQESTQHILTTPAIVANPEILITEIFPTMDEIRSRPHLTGERLSLNRAQGNKTYLLENINLGGKRTLTVNGAGNVWIFPTSRQYSAADYDLWPISDDHEIIIELELLISRQTPGNTFMQVCLPGLRNKRYRDDTLINLISDKTDRFNSYNVDSRGVKYIPIDSYIDYTFRTLIGEEGMSPSLRIRTTLSAFKNGCHVFPFRQGQVEHDRDLSKEPRVAYRVYTYIEKSGHDTGGHIGNTESRYHYT